MVCGVQDIPVLHVRRIGKSLGIVFPKQWTRRLALRPGDPVRVEIQRVATIEEVAGRLADYGLSVSEWNDATNEGEPL